MIDRITDNGDGTYTHHLRPAAFPAYWVCNDCQKRLPVAWGWRCAECGAYGIGDHHCACTGTAGTMPHHPPTESFGVVVDKDEGTETPVTDIRCGRCALAMVEAEEEKEQR